ncbi:MAG: phosphoglycerate kinase [Chloroflexi bacterium]|nr:phosphoglycerate kinase [Chloroflexota bacterium]
MKKTIADVDVAGKRVFVRVDFNVPMDPKTRQILDDTRIRAALPTIRSLIDHGASVILASHLGRPKGPSEDLRMAPIARRLAELLDRPVQTAPDCVGPEVEAAVGRLRPGDVLMLENVRFHPEEEKNDPEFARKLASLADLYVNDAFGTAHRAHASTAGIARHLPAVAGFLMEKEIEHLGRILEHPARPFAAVIGGAKISSKIAVLKSLLQRVDALLIGGGMANTFLKARGYEIGRSLVEDDQLDTARDLMQAATAAGVPLLLPVDVTIGDHYAADAERRVVEVGQIPADWSIMDIGPRTAERYVKELRRARTVFWNGPMGVFEFPRFADGTQATARALAEVDATTVVGGGESVAAVEQLGLADRITHVSTGGGASLEFLEGRTLPGVQVLQDRT